MGKNHQDRKTLKKYFLKGSRPTEEHFRNLIDSTFNKADDGLEIDKINGLILYATEKGKIISLFEDKDQDEPKWQLIASKKDDGLRINESYDALQTEDSPLELERKPPLFLQKGGGIGIRTNKPKQALDVNGIISSNGRLGNYLDDKANSVDADGKWHNVFPESQTGCNAYEIMAYAEGKEGEGKYSLLHATVVSTYGSSASEITRTCSHYGEWWNKIDIRWEARPSRIAVDDNTPKLNFWNRLWEKREQKYNLQLKTKRDYGSGCKIQFTISVLWKDKRTTNTMGRQNGAPLTDDLTKIEGIGPKVAEALINAGIDSYAKLADLQPKQIKTILVEASFHTAYIKPETWPKQAEMAAEDNFNMLRKWQKELKGGVERKV